MNTFRNLSLCTLLLFLCLVNVSQAATPEGRHGWLSASALIGDDLTCGAGKIRFDLELLEYGTNNPITVPSAVIQTYTISSGANGVSSSGAGPIVPSLCMNPLTEGFIFDISGGASYYDFWSASQWQAANPLPTGKHYRYTVWLAPAPGTAHYTQVSPVNTVVNVNPSYQLAVNSFPSTYGATGVSSLNFFLRNYNPITNTIGSKVDGRVVSLSGGTGIKTIPPTPGLADGMYTWAGYLQLNGTNSLTDGASVINFEDVSKTPLIAYSWPFMLDSTPPVVATSSGHVPVSPTNNDTITLTGEASDTLSGITMIKVFVDGVHSKTCNFASVNSALCDLNVGPFSASTTVSYNFVAFDQAGNSINSAVQSFTVTSAPSLPVPPIGTPLTCDSSESAMIDKKPASVFGSLYSPKNPGEYELLSASVGNYASAQAIGGNGTPQALKIVGDYAFVGASGNDSAVGLYVFDVANPEGILQRAFFSTHYSDSSEPVQNNTWGNDVTGLDVEGNYAYLTTYYGGLVIVDVTEPAEPIFAGKVPLFNLNLPGDHESWAVEVVGDYAFIAAGHGMIVVDVTDKATPEVKQNFALGAEVSQDITIEGNYAYVALRSEGVAIFDITNPTDVTLMSLINGAYNGSNWAYGVAVSGNYLYVANHLGSSIRIYDISDKTNPILMSNTLLPDATGMRGIYVNEGALFVGADTSGAYVFDISNPISPRVLYQVTEPALLPSAKVWDVAPISSGNFTDIIIVSEDTDAGIYRVETQCEPVLLPDLVATSTISSGAVVAPGATITFSTGDIINEGTSEAPGYMLGGFYVDADGDGWHDYETEILPQVQTSAVGSSTRSDTTWTVPIDAVPGNYQVSYIINDPNSFEESDYDNNWSGWTTFTVTGSAVPVVSALLASPNPITQGNSTQLSWTVSGDAQWCWLEGTGGGWQDPTNGSKSISVTPPDTETYTIECGNTFGNSDIESREVTVNPPATVTLSPVGCYIAASSSTCDGQVSWQFTGGTPPYVVENTTNDYVYGETDGGSSVPATLNQGPNTIVARDSAGLSRTETVDGICDSSVNTWNAGSGICEPNPLPPDIALNTEFTLVRSGVSAPIEIEITSTEAVTCQLINAEESLIEFSHDPALGVTQEYNSYSTRPLTSAQVVTVSCSLDANPSVMSEEEIRISVIGIMEEM